ncbi:MAG: DISARM system phospholipase D-like protein DrmC [Holophagaceae bacterium]|nr:DISARM system phospholipase D-like protein DrmC [Holophagaceae bacterium]
MTLWDVIAAAAKELHPDRMEAAARAAESRNPAGFRTWAQGAGALVLTQVGKAWLECPGTTGKEIASALRAAGSTARAIRAQSRVDLVWSGPDTRLVPVRRTDQVLLELIETSERTLFLVSFVAYNVESLLMALKKALARGVEVSFLLEAPEAGHISIDSPGLIRGALPAAKVYQWEPKEAVPGGQGAVHAKCLLADGKAAFITSANLTNAAMEKNMELGVKLTGGAVPEQLRAHFEALIATREIVPV